jgi:hypothetical protein
MQAFFVRLIIHQIGSSNVRGVCACACVQNSVQQTRTCDVRRILDLSIECCRVAEASAVQYSTSDCTLERLPDRRSPCGQFKPVKTSGRCAHACLPDRRSPCGQFKPVKTSGRCAPLRALGERLARSSQWSRDKLLSTRADPIIRSRSIVTLLSCWSTQHITSGRSLPS